MHGAKGVKTIAKTAFKSAINDFPKYGTTLTQSQANSIENNVFWGTKEFSCVKMADEVAVDWLTAYCSL